MLGQVVLLRLQEQYTLAAVSAVHDADIVDLRALALYADGRFGLVEISAAHRGAGVGQWLPAPMTASPPLAAVQAQLMPVSSLPTTPPPMPLMVIIRY